jgi:hypothetical protein
MELAFGEAWRARRTPAGACPGCRGERLRFSMRRYDGAFARLFRLRPAKCLDCGLYFPVSQDSPMSNRPEESEELPVPFWPIGPDESAGLAQSPAPRWSPLEGRAARPGIRGSCPFCGSPDVRPSELGWEGGPPRIFSIRASYRCTTCNAGFPRVVLSRVGAAILLAGALFAGLAYAASMLSARPSTSPTPTLKRGQIPKPRPPVFR